MSRFGAHTFGVSVCFFVWRTADNMSSDHIINLVLSALCSMTFASDSFGWITLMIKSFMIRTFNNADDHDARELLLCQ